MWYTRLDVRIVQPPIQTGRSLAQQMKEHKSALTNAHPERSAIAEHAANTGHTIDWSNTQIKAVMPPFWQRCTLETWYIYMRSQPHPLNQEEGILPHVCDTLIRDDTPHTHGASTAQN